MSNINSIQKLKEDILYERFIKVEPSNSKNIPSKNDIGVKVLYRITLGENNFSKFELKQTQPIIDKINYYKSRYPKFPIIIDNLGSVFLGGDQGWYSLNGHYTKAFAGCGPTSGANIAASLIWQDKNFAKKTGYTLWNKYKIATKGEFLNLMEEMYNYITPLEFSLFNINLKYDYAKGKNKIIPPSFGYFLNNRYQKSLLRYFGSYNFQLISKNHIGIPNNKKYADILDFRFKSDLPISFLHTLGLINFYNPDNTFSQKSNMHWVNIIKAEPNKIFISSWGQEFYIKPEEIRDNILKRFFNNLNRLSIFIR